jgi:polysaccharide export outer membrane protein
MKRTIPLLSFIILTCFLFSCGSVKELQLMQGSFDTARLSQVQVPDPVIQKGDILSVIVYSDNDLASAKYNQPIIASQAAANPIGGSAEAASPKSGGYLVDKSGNIQFPQLGVLHVEGLTKDGLTLLLDSKLKDTLLKNPYYSIRFLNFKITIMGEVNNPGVLSADDEKLNLLQAISRAGDLTYFARRDNVRIIRETSGKREFGEVDLTKPELFTSPYFNLQQNDIVMVDLRPKKIAANDQLWVRNVTVTVSILSAVALIANLFR